MSIFKSISIDAVLISRTDPEDILGSFSAHSFHLDDEQWPTVEHYYQAKKFDNTEYQKKIHAAPTPEKAKRLGNRWFARKRPDYKQVKITLMTRAVYIKCKTHETVREALLDTEETAIADRGFTDYFWGCGRDGRGDNHYGKILMRVRDKLKQELRDDSTEELVTSDN